jgi:uncharacterized protein YbjT (DUF2867 family)
MAHFIIAGSTGLIGGELANQLVDPKTEITLLSRRPIETKLPHHKVLMTNFDAISLPQAVTDNDAIFCALGTTIKKAGSKEAFRAVDYSLVVDLANAAKRAGYESFVVISSLGVNENTNNFYLKTKAEMETALTQVGFRSLTILRPSLLLGERNEFRLGERIAEKVSFLLRPLFMGNLKRYLPISAHNVARAMINAASQKTEGVQVIESEQIALLAVEKGN